MGGRLKFWAVSVLLQVVLASNAFALVSDDYSSLDVDSPARQILVRDQNRAINKILMASKNYRNILNTLFAIDNRPSSRPVGALNDGSVLFINDAGIGAQEQLVLKDSQKETVILSMSDLKLGKHVSLTQASISPNKQWVLLLLSVNGAITDYKVVVYDLVGKKIAKEFADMSFSSMIQWVSPEVFIAAVNKTGPGMNWLAYNIQSGQNQIMTTEQLMGTAQRTSDGEVNKTTDVGEAFKSAINDITASVEEVISKDGSKVPIVVRRLKILALDGQNPVLIKSYGGFGVNFLARNQPDIGEIFFLLRGGILVHTGLRGGGEMGEPWYRQGVGAKNKIKTYEDLIAVAQTLVTQGWTTPKKIVSTGTSNGGLTVAAAALLSPGTFGLVIPIAGVLDVVKYPTLDAPFFTDWFADYGNPEDAGDLEALVKISPMENSDKQGDTKFLVMAGSTDDRVNVAHSIKFFAALKERGGHPDQTHLSITMNAGHALTSVEVGDINGWTASTTYWTFIYDHLGMKF